jgi:hypothetical protein
MNSMITPPDYMNPKILHYSEIKRELNFIYDRANMNYTHKLMRKIILYTYAIDLMRIELMDDGYILRIRHNKTEQEEVQV